MQYDVALFEMSNNFGYLHKEHSYENSNKEVI